MPPHKARARGHNNPQPPPQPSDYETDAPPATLDVPLPPTRSNEELNLAVLKRKYPELLAIEHVTPFAAMYTFNLETQGWEKMGIEGALFICQLALSPVGAERYCVVILNRRGMDNFYLELTSSEDLEVSDPFVIVQADQVYGIWIHADPPPSSTANCRIETAEKIIEAADRANTSREAKESVGKNNVRVQADGAVPMGRQLSLRELFGHNIMSMSSSQAPQQPPQASFMPVAQPAPMQQDVLGQLFMKAKQDYNGHG